MSTAVKTEHPHIVRVPGVCGGEPVVDGLRVAVRHVAALHLRGEGIAEIAEALGLTDAQVFHALSYFADHRSEIESLIAQDEQAASQGMANDPSHSPPTQADPLPELPEWSDVYQGLSDAEIDDLDKAIRERANLSRSSNGST